MKSGYILWMAIAAMLVSGEAASFFAEETVMIQGDVWPPYVMDPASGKNGFMIDIATAALEGTKYRIQYANVPWSRALGGADKGTIAGVVGIYEAEANLHAYVIPSEELGLSVNHFYTRTDSAWKYQGVSSLSGIVIATIQSYDYGEITKYVNGRIAEQSPSVVAMTGDKALERNLAMLQAGRVGAVVEDADVIRMVANRLGMTGKLRDAGIVPPASKVFIALSPKYANAADLAKTLSGGIVQLRKSGRLAKILESYGVKDWK